MKWNKAGRPAKNGAVNVSINIYTDRKEDGEWTKEELTLIKHGPEALVRAVVKQWKDDGSPDDPGITQWLEMLTMLEQKNTHNKTEYSVGIQEG